MTGVKITEERFLQEKAEEMLRASEEKYRLITQNMRDVVWQTTPDLVITYVTSSVKKLFGYEPQELVGKHLSCLLTPAAKELVENRYPDIMLRLAEHNEFDTEVSVVEQIRKDGTTVWTEVVTAPAIDGAGQFIGFQGVTRDVSKRKRNEEALRASEEKYRNLVESISDVIFEVDARGVLTYISPAVRNVFGYEAEDFMGKSFLEFVYPEDSGFLIKRFAELTKGVEYPLEYRVVGKSGKVHHVRTYTKPIMKENTFAGARGTLIDITDRKHAEASLRESEDNLKSFFHTIPEKVFLMKLDGSILTANEPFATGLGKSAEEIIGDCVYDYLDPSVATRRKAWTNEVVRSGKPLRFEDERQNSILVHNIYPILNPEGAVDRLAVYAKDVTEARQSKLALKKSEERWSRISSLTSDIAYSCRKSDDTGYSIDWMVGATDRILGYSVDEIKALRCWRNLVVEEDLPVFDSHVTGLSPGMSASCELRLLHRDGNVVWLSSLAQCVCESGSSNTPCLYGGLVNISERKSSEEALRASEARYRQLADITFEGIIFHDQGVLLQANDQFFQMFGYEPDELLGTQILEKTLSPESVKIVKTHIAARSTESYLAMGLRKDGSAFPIEIRARMREIEGKKIRATAIRDLTMLKSLETQLIQAQKMEAIGTLAGGFAHDFNNKLQVIAGYVELILCNEELPDNLKHDIDAIGQAVHASAELIREMLVFSRKTIVKFERLDLNRLVTQLRSMLVPVMPKMINIELVLAGDLWPINAAPNQIDQILMNLSVNARDAMPEGGKLTIQTQNTILDEEYCRYHPNTKPGRYVLLSVTDTGSGMDAGTVKRIFEPFFTTKEEGKGTGLGLSVVYGIVEKHGGNIICDSDPSVGTTFKIFLPTTEEVTEEEHSEKTEPPKGQGETILLVDDEPNLVNIVSRQLVSANYRVIKASNGNEALNLYEEHREQISLVILDLLMPEMDGRRCLDALHDIDPNVRVLVATGHTTPGMLGELEQAGVQGFIRKPFETSQLLEEIRKIIDED